MVVPESAKSAATLLAMGVHSILMGPTSDVGPVDPQFRINPRRGLVAAKDLIEAVESAMREVAEKPDTYPLHASLLADVDALLVQQARSALARTEDLMREALSASRTPAKVDELVTALRGPLMDRPRSHAAVFGVRDARAAGLPAKSIDHRSRQWQLIWRLWTKYAVMGPAAIYEGEWASKIMRHQIAGQAGM